MEAINLEELRVLLVDDQPQVLSGLKRNLRMEQEDWNVDTAGGGDEALELLSRKTFDIVVSDLRMPGMSGATFLYETRERHPEVLRFVLSGYADQDLMLKASGVAHRYLTKPCETEDLINAIKQVYSTQALIQNETVIRIVNSTCDLHADVSPIQKLIELTEDPESDMAALGGLVEQHPSVHASLLHIANSSFFGGGSRIETMHDALQVLGMELTRSIAVHELSKQSFNLSDKGMRCAARILKHCVEVSRMAMRLKGDLADRTVKKRLVSAAMLHDLGKVLLLSFDEETFIATCARSLQEKRAAVFVERETFGCDHAAIAAYLFDLWGLPEQIVRCIAWHHEPELLAGEHRKSDAALLHIANYLAHRRDSNHYCHYERVSDALLERMEISITQNN